MFLCFKRDKDISLKQTLIFSLIAFVTGSCAIVFSLFRKTDDVFHSEVQFFMLLLIRINDRNTVSIKNSAFEAERISGFDSPPSH